MDNEIHVPGFDEAIAEERKDRALAFLPLKEDICGIKCNKLTPLLMEWLRAYDNPFICGGDVQPAHVAQFLWIVSEQFQKGDKDIFTAKIIAMDAKRLVAEIEEYLERVFMDSPYGKAGMPYYSYAAGLVHQMAKSPFGWAMEYTLNQPIAVIFQLMKARDNDAGRVVVNRKSQGVRARWLDEMNAPKKGGKRRGR